MVSSTRWDEHGACALPLPPPSPKFSATQHPMTAQLPLWAVTEECAIMAQPDLWHPATLQLMEPSMQLQPAGDRKEWQLPNIWWQQLLIMLPRGLFFYWVGFLSHSEPIIDAACCYWSYMAGSSYGEQHLWSSGSQLPEDLQPSTKLYSLAAAISLFMTTSLCKPCGLSKHIHSQGPYAKSLKPNIF